MLVDCVDYIDIPYTTRERCSICGKLCEDPIINLPNFPITEVYTAEKPTQDCGRVDQYFCMCSQCGHGQLRNVIDPKFLYGASNYNFRTSQSLTGRTTADSFVDFFNDRTKDYSFKTIIEVGCNDLYLLERLSNRAEQLIGIDPILRGYDSTEKITVVGDFFENYDCMETVDCILCKDTLEHVEEPYEFLERIVDSGHDNTLFCFGFPLLDVLFDESRFEQIFHQHLNYFSLSSLSYTLDRLGCVIVDYIILHEHWGSIIVLFRKKEKGERNSALRVPIETSGIRERYSVFADILSSNGKILDSMRDQEEMYGFGAALMLPVLGYHLKSDLSCLKCILDEDISKSGRYYINFLVDVRHFDTLKKNDGCTFVITAPFSNINVEKILRKLSGYRPLRVINPLKMIRRNLWD